MWLLVIGCGGSASPASRSPTIMNDATDPPAASADDRLAAELARLPEAHVVYLHPVGWFSTTYFKGYEGTNPRTGEPVHVPGKLTIYWSSSPAFLAALVHQPSPILDRYPTEKARYRAAMSLEADPPDDADDPTVVLRPAWADALGERLRLELVAGGHAVIRGVGTLEVARDRPEAYVRFHGEGAAEDVEDRD
jgi:nucleoid DNA-binding protein